MIKGSWPAYFRSIRNVCALVTHTALCGHDVASDMEAQMFYIHKIFHHKAQSSTKSSKNSNHQQKQLFPHCFTLCFLLSLPFTCSQPSDVPHLPETHILISSHMHPVLLALCWKQWEKGKASYTPLRNADWIISTWSFQNAPLRTNKQQTQSIPQANDYFRISPTAVPKAHGWLRRTDYVAKMNTDN